MLGEFLCTTTRTTCAEKVQRHLEIFMSLGAPVASVMYFSANEGNKECAGNMIRNFANTVGVYPKNTQL